MATTTSVQSSGLLETLLPHFTSAIVRVHAAGSGRSLEMLGDGIVDGHVVGSSDVVANRTAAGPCRASEAARYAVEARRLLDEIRKEAGSDDLMKRADLRAIQEAAASSRATKS